MLLYQQQKLYHVSTEVTTLGTSVFVLGFAVGPLVYAFHYFPVPSLYETAFKLDPCSPSVNRLSVGHSLLTSIMFGSSI